MKKIKLISTVLSFTLVFPVFSQITGYNYAFVMTPEYYLQSSPESVPPMQLGNKEIKPKECYFTPELDLSKLSDPVLMCWIPNGSYGIIDLEPLYTVLNYGSNYIGIDSPNTELMTALPSLRNIRIGRNKHNRNKYEVLTVGERPVNQNDVVIDDYEVKIVKGEIRDSYDRVVIPVKSERDDYPESEIRITAQGMSDLTQACFSVCVHNDILVDTLTDGGEQGQVVCSVMTENGEVFPCLIGGEKCDYHSESYSYSFLLPEKSNEIVLRWRFPNNDYNEYDAYEACTTKPLDKLMQPGYHKLPELGFNLGDLTGEFGDFMSEKILSVKIGMDVNTIYDFDGDGLKEAVGSGRVNESSLPGLDTSISNAIVGFNEDMNDVLVKNLDFGSALAFSPSFRKTFGYNKSSIFSVDKEFKKKEIYTASNPRFAFIDFDNDGCTDFLNLTDNSIIILDSDGFPTVQNLITITMDDYLGTLSPGENPLGSGLSVVGDSKSPPAVFASYQNMDINGDGYPDFIDAASGCYYLNLGDGRFVTDSFGGKFMLRDFDGDGVNDFLLYDSSTKTVSLTLQRLGSDSVIKKLISGYNCGEEIWARDFDGDGDVDILIPFNAENNGGMSFLVMFENKGDGSFQKTEYSIKGSVNFRKCVDWNSDGNYEVLTDMATDADTYSVPVGKIASYVLDGLKVNTAPSYILCKNRLSSKLKDVVDLDNSGQPRFLLESGNMSTDILSPSTNINSRPQKPNAPRLDFNSESGELTVTWVKGQDKETAPSDLTYELRIGTASGCDDIMSVASTADGKRLNTMSGNCGYELKRKFNTLSWPSGQIYIAIQTIDDSGLGSSFSDDAIFSNTQLPAQFVIESPVGVAIYEEIILKALSDVNALSVSWNAEGGEVVLESKSEAHVRFDTPGKKIVSMTVSDDLGNFKTTSKSIEVYPVRFEHLSDMLYVDWAADLDLDGRQEVHCEYHNNFYEGDINGGYSKLSSLFNTRNYEDPIYADINRDGLIDIIHDGGHLVNIGDKSMDDATPVNFNNGYIYFPDLDNDGLRDVYYYNGHNEFVMKNSGNYDDFFEIDNGTFSPSCFNQYVQYFDFNKDGLTDVYYLTDNFKFLGFGTTAEPLRYENLGNFRFKKVELPTELNGEKFSYCLVGDFDGNGDADYICITNNREYFVLWDNNERTDIDLDGFQMLSSYDFDNNGCTDVMFSNGVVLFNADHTFSIVETEAAKKLFIPYLRSDGKPGINNYVIYSAPNDKPSAPSSVNAKIEGNQLVISWDAAVDKETPSAGLRYNLSVKHVGVDGEDAFVISPLNGGKDFIPLPNDAHLISSTVFPIPILALSKGEYEIKVQAVDGRRETSAFSLPVYINIETEGYEAPSETMVGDTVEITFSPHINISDVDYGVDAVLEKTIGNTACVKWMSEGTKTIKAGDLEFNILVHPVLDASIPLPEEIAGGAFVYLPADVAFEHTWQLYGYWRSFSTWVDKGELQAERVDDSTVRIRFNYDHQLSMLRLEHTVKAPYGSSKAEVYFEIYNTYTPQIGIVDIDEESGKYCVHSMECDKDVVEYMVYKETETLNEYEYLGSIPGNSSFIDETSSPMEHTSRYMIKSRFYYGESLQSKVHQPIHAIISQGINGEWNIEWSKYEGRSVDTYRIMRGNNPHDLDCIAEVSGNTTSYSDFNAPASTQYYVVETLIPRPAPSNAPLFDTRSGDNYWRSRSNTVSTIDAGVEGIITDSDDLVDIFNIHGVCIRRNATLNDIKNLEPGIYVINGKKIKI